MDDLMDDLKAQLAQLKKDLAEHRQLNETALHGEDEVARSIEAEIERRIAVIEELLDKVERS
jgi:transcription elongation GreA/GreB family factor